MKYRKNAQWGTRTKTLTATGVARMLARGVRANSASDRQGDDIQELCKLLADMAMSRATDAEWSESHAEKKQAEIDTDFLAEVADALGEEQE